MQEVVCQGCGASFPLVAVIDGKKVDLRGRKQCLDCAPYRPLTRPRKPVPHAAKLLVCEACGSTFPAKQVINGEMRSLYRRRFVSTVRRSGRTTPRGLHLER